MPSKGHHLVFPVHARTYKRNLWTIVKHEYLYSEPTRLHTFSGRTDRVGNGISLGGIRNGSCFMYALKRSHSAPRGGCFLLF